MTPVYSMVLVGSMLPLEGNGRRWEWFVCAEVGVWMLL